MNMLRLLLLTHHQHHITVIQRHFAKIVRPRSLSVWMRPSNILRDSEIILWQYKAEIELDEGISGRRLLKEQLEVDEVYVWIHNGTGVLLPSVIQI